MKILGYKPEPYESESYSQLHERLHSSLWQCQPVAEMAVWVEPKEKKGWLWRILR